MPIIGEEMVLLKLWWEKGLNLNVHYLVLSALLLLVIIWLIYLCSRTKYKGEFEIDEAEIGIGNQKVKIKPNFQDKQIAYQLWVELSTRKIGLPIDFEHDVISEIYDSWYEFFKITRELIKDLPISKVGRHKSTQKIVNVSIDVLNEGLRPHLTKWQARYRRWYSSELEKQENALKSPQEIQGGCPYYAQLTEDMREVNKKLIIYREKMRELSLGLPVSDNEK